MKTKIERKGEKYITREGYEIEVLECFSAKNCTVVFQNGVILYNRAFKEIKNGQIKNPFHKSVYGVGYSGQGIYRISNNRVINKCGNTWSKMIERCYSKPPPTYINCSVDDEWHNFQNFAKWFYENYDDSIMQGWELDKDILVKGNKVYSSKTCCFVPPEINKLFTKNNAMRMELPIGVTKTQNRYMARMHNKYIGTFNTIEEAFQAYKTAKEDYIKEVADKWKSSITEKCYQAMYNYQVEITD